MSGYLSADNGVLISFEDSKEFPSSLGTSNSASWTANNTMTSWAPLLGFSYSGPFTINLSILFSIEEGPVMPRVKACRSLVVATYGPYRPPIIEVEIENYVSGFIGVATSVADNVSDQSAWIDGDPVSATVTISLQECADGPLTSVYGK